MDTVEYAGFWKRFFAAIVDNVLIFVVGGIIAVFFGAVFGVLTGSVVGAVFREGFFLPTFFSTLFFFVAAFYILIRWFYFAVMESSSYQATFGKQLLSIKVTDMEGMRISFWKATIRYFAKILSELIFYIGYIMIGFTPKKQGLHDMIAGCLVIVDRK